jgi:hypothetical protein
MTPLDTVALDRAIAAAAHLFAAALASIEEDIDALHAEVADVRARVDYYAAARDYDRACSRVMVRLFDDASMERIMCGAILHHTLCQLMNIQRDDLRPRS